MEKEQDMTDPLMDGKDDAELGTINAERSVLGLEPLTSIEEARAWKAGQTAEGGKTEKPAEAVKPVEEKASETKVFAAPEAVKPGAQAAESADKARIAELERKLQLVSTEEGRVAKLDRLLKESEARLAAAEAKAAEAERKAQEAAEKAAEGDVLAGLTDDQKALLGADPKAVAEVIAMLTKRFAGKPVQPDLSRLDEMTQRLTAAEEFAKAQAQAAMQTRINNMWAEVQKAVPSDVYSKFAGDPKWGEWYVQTYGGIANGDLYYNAVNTADADAVVDLFSRFMRYAKIEVPAKGQKPPLRAEKSLGGQAPVIPEADVFYEDDVNRIDEEFCAGRLPSGWTQNQFNAWTKRVQEARYAGRIKPGRAPR